LYLLLCIFKKYNPHTVKIQEYKNTSGEAEIRKEGWRRRREVYRQNEE
jgi:hypothetical protein